MHAALLCIVPDGTTPTDGTLVRVAEETTIRWPVGDGGEIAIQVQGEDGEIYDLAECTLTLVCRLHTADTTPVLEYEADIDPTPEGGVAPGTATVTVLGADTAAMAAGVPYLFDIRLVDADDKIFHILPPSKWFPEMTIARSGEPPAPPAP